MMQHRKIDGEPIVIREYADFKQDKAITLNRIRIAEITEAGKAMVEDYPALAAWFCLQVLPNRETAVDNLLRQADVISLVLREPEEIVVRRGRQWVMPGKVWLPGFVLVNCVPSNSAFRGLLGVQDVFDIVGGWMRAYRVPKDSISKFNDVMAENEEERERKRIEQETRNASIKPGDAVTIRLGPFAGFKARVLSVGKGSGRRCKLEYKLHGKTGEVTIPLANLEKP